MAIKIKSTKKEIDSVKMLVHAKGGMGKTRLCSTAPNPIILSAESGLLSLRDYDLPYIEINTIADLEEAYIFVSESDDAKKYDTICLDSITEIAEVLLTSHKRNEKDPRAAYGKLSDDMTTLIRGFRDLPGKHVYFSAKQERITDDFTGITTYQAMMPGRTLRQGTGYFFDEVATIRIGEDEDGDKFRYLQCTPDISYDCKDRSGSLGEIEKPDLSYIFNKIINEHKEK